MDRQINIITVQLKTEVNTGRKTVKAYWVAWWRHIGKPLIAMGRGWGIEVTWWYNVKKHFFHTHP